MIAPGRVPIRAPENRIAGRAPVPGWDAAYDWKGFIPVDDVPRVDDPNIGAVGTANARIVDADYRYHLTYDWDPAFRQQRIKQLVFDRDKHDINSMRAALADVFSPAVSRLQPLMIAQAQAGGAVDNAILDQLTTWDATMRADRPEPLIFTAWLRETIRAIYGDDLGPAFRSYFDYRATALLRLLDGKATGRDWCDDRSTPERERCGSILAAALDIALRDLAQRYGPDRAKWRYGDAHFAYSEHRPFGVVPSMAGYFNITVPSPGGNYTLNRGKAEFGEEAAPFANRHASSYRAIYDLADLEKSLFIQTTGQSGNFLSPFYRSFAERWAKVEFIEIPTRRDTIGKSALGTWRLDPK
jgi:penicillin amidase